MTPPDVGAAVAAGRRGQPSQQGLAGRTVVVLGGTGFLGTHLSGALAAAGARVVSVARSAPAAAGSRAVALDLLHADPEDLARLVRSSGAEVVINAAGRAWRADEAEMAAGNATLVTRLNRALAGLADPPRVVQLGSVHEYGPGVPGAATGEEQEPRPVTPYGRTKWEGSRAVLGAARAHGLDAVVLRLANVIGPGAPAGSLFGTVAAHLAEGARSRRLGLPPAPLRLAPLRAHRDVVDVRDAVDAVMAAACAPSAVVAGRVINVGGGAAVSMRELVERMIALSGLEVALLETARPAPARTDVDWQLLDITRARRLLGWRPRVGLEQSLRDLLGAVTPSDDERAGR